MSSEDCVLCNIEKGELGSYKIYEDEKVIAALAPEPASLGHIILFPKKHYQIIELVPDYEIAYLFNIANKLSIAVFESLGMQGTNILIQNGNPAGQEIPHLAINIIPRKEDDNLNFQWKPKQLDEEEISVVEIQLKQACETIGKFEKEEKKLPLNIEKKIEVIKEKKNNYLFKQLERIP